ncbi:MAG: hypothetical protein WBF90_32200 [Rivularia sp. (in: cyanobacteria)]
MNYDFARHCYLLAEDQFNEGCKCSFKRKHYAERCFKRADNFWAIAEFLGYTHEIHAEIEMNIEIELSGY